jgi:hypothetical protein
MTVSKLPALVSGPVIARSVSDEAIQPFFVRRDGLLRFARNDGLARIRASRWLAVTVSNSNAPTKPQFAAKQ